MEGIVGEIRTKVFLLLFKFDLIYNFLWNYLKKRVSQQEERGFCYG
jgi:hypothetical protein